MSSTTASRKETERTKLIQEKCQTLLTQMLRDEDNKYCVDCDAKGPRWASWNLGVFLCIRCAGIHRNLGVHISRVKSVNLDTWTPEQVISLQQMGNSRARAVYEAQLPDGFRRPQTDTALESFIRAKYEHKKYLAREWVPPLPPKVDWAKEIDDELEKQKRKKKAAQAGSALGIGVMSSGGGDKKIAITTVKSNASLPAPLPKPKGHSNSSPKTPRISSGYSGGDVHQTNDLLGLSSPTKPIPSGGGHVGTALDLQNDSFTGFLSATPIAPVTDNRNAETNANVQNPIQSALAKEEEDFFNQGTLCESAGDRDKSGKLTKDSILALYANAPTNVTAAHNPQLNFGQPQPMFGATGAFTAMAPGYMGAGSVPHPQQQQFMTPPNSTSMYNTPVMTAPAAFTGPGMGMNMGVTVAGAGFGAQFPVQGIAGAAAGGYSQPMLGSMSMMPGAGAIMATGQTSAPASLNLMHSNNQNLLSGMTMAGSGLTPMAQTQGMAALGMGAMSLTSGLPQAYQAPSSAATANLNQQFGNLNIGNVWQ